MKLYSKNLWNIYVTILLVSFFFTFCKSTQTLNLIEASKESWRSGMNGGGNGTEYYFDVKVLTASKINFDSLWVNGIVLPIYIAHKSTRISQEPLKFSKNDTITLRATYLSLESKTKGKTPVAMQGEALLSYNIDGKNYYLNVANIKVLKGTPRP